MIFISIFPYSGLTGKLSLSIYGLVFVLILGVTMLVFAFNLYSRMDVNSAKKLFMYTVFYLSSVQLIYIFDKFL